MGLFPDFQTAFMEVRYNYGKYHINPSHSGLYFIKSLFIKGLLFNVVRGSEFGSNFYRCYNLR